jgi:DNA adenine methylase
MQITPFLRYPGSKRRMLSFLTEHLPQCSSLKGSFIEPFVGGAAIYFFLAPKKALLSDINSELIDLYEGIKKSPARVWQIYRSFLPGKRGYKTIRDIDVSSLTDLQRAARVLYLNRTCFKGMWRHNRAGKFNVGYGGQSRRWCIARKDLHDVSRLLQSAELRRSDFEDVIAEATPADFLFLDPPYRPGAREQIHDHYSAKQFAFSDHRRLASTLRAADKRGVPWSLTVSSHRDILNLYRGFRVLPVPVGTGMRIGELTSRTGEVLISN